MIAIISEFVLNSQLSIIKRYMTVSPIKYRWIWQLGAESSSLIEIWRHSWTPGRNRDSRRILALYILLLTSISLKQVVSR